MIKLDVIKNSMVLTHSANCYNILKMLHKHFSWINVLQKEMTKNSAKGLKHYEIKDAVT